MVSRSAISLGLLTMLSLELLAARGPASAIQTAPALGERVVVVRPARILDVVQGQYLSGRELVIRNAKIVAVQRQGSRVPAGATIVDLADTTVLPGLIDAHVHLALGAAATEAVPGAEDAKRTLEAGFTTVRDLGANGFGNVALARAIATGQIDGPRIVAAGPGLGPPGGVCDRVFGPGGTVASADDVSRVVAAQAAAGARVIKMCAGGGVLPGQAAPFPELTEPLVRAIVAEAHRHGLHVAAHATTAAAVALAARSGADSVEHGGLLDDAAIRSLADSRAVLVPTLYRLDWTLEQSTGGAPAALSQSLRDQSFEAAARARQAGVRIAMGTDATVIPHGTNARELRALRAIGLSPLDALRAATLVAAELLDLRNDVGRIAPGYDADLVGVSGDPLQDPTVLERVAFVMRGGRVIVPRPAAAPKL